jgi:uncharacterized protein YebE (UPF0316 family)
MQALLGYLFIFFARVIDVSLGTTRMLMVFRGKKVYAALVGFVEVTVYVVALSRVVNSLTNIWNLLAYASGFATGNIVGSIIEEWMALGYLSVQVIPTTLPLADKLAARLRDHGLGVTVIQGEGREGPKKILNISLQRKALQQMLSVIDDVDAEAFVTILDTRHRIGGVFPRRLGKES